MTLSATTVKEAAVDLGADLCGIATMDRFEGAPKQQDPRYIFPEAEACIVLGFRIPRGYFRGIEEGTYFAAYTALGYGGMNEVYMPTVLRRLCCFVEDQGYEAAPIPNHYPGCSISFATRKPVVGGSRPVRDGLPNPDVLVDFRIAAFAAGLGQFGWSKVFLTPEFGPAQRFVAILTDAPLEADPIYEGELCDRCMRCVKECSGNAISTTETESITIAGHRVEWGKLDVLKCSIAYRGGNAEYNPFMDPAAREDAYNETYCGGNRLAGLCGYPNVYRHNPALEGARGCIRACMAHLQDSGRLKRNFANPFRKRPPWKVDPMAPRQASPEES